MKSITKSKSFESLKDICAECGKNHILINDMFCTSCHYKMILNSPCCICKKFNIKNTENYDITVCFNCYLKTKTK